MRLAIGTRLGEYEVLALLGTGGMGEVYRARDTTLGRDVALKVLAPAFGAVPERLARFEREARVLAALNHPNIGAIYGVERAAPTADGPGPSALVLELVDGETLEDRIARSPAPAGLPAGEVLAAARQIVDALDAAHERGIVHRDLKPANIKVTGDGRVKVLDFGIAKAALEEPDSDLSQVATRTSSSTRFGQVLGTPAYMSPEQARGRPLDKRTDIWAFGCVLYEMLSGRVAFPGDTASDAIAAILEREPDWSALPASTPQALVELTRRCLAKDPRDRLRDIGDARADLAREPGDSRATALGSRRWTAKTRCGHGRCGRVAGRRGGTRGTSHRSRRVGLLANAVALLGVTAGGDGVPSRTERDVLCPVA